MKTVLEGLKIFEKYGCGDFCAEHDEIYVHIEVKISEVDKKKLDDLGWSVCEETEISWFKNV